jgi:heptose I phosphotransferase
MSPPAPGVRVALIKKVADSARRMHEAGINHRDFYLCHFHLAPETLVGNTWRSVNIRCYLIDLHRAQIRRRTPYRWQVKDLAGLYFSAMDAGLTRRDLHRFMHYYTQGGLREALGEGAEMWGEVAQRAAKLYRKDHGEEPPPLLLRGPR